MVDFVTEHLDTPDGQVTVTGSPAAVAAAARAIRGKPTALTALKSIRAYLFDGFPGAVSREGNHLEGLARSAIEALEGDGSARG